MEYVEVFRRMFSFRSLAALLVINVAVLIPFVIFLSLEEFIPFHRGSIFELVRLGLICCAVGTFLIGFPVMYRMRASLQTSLAAYNRETIFWTLIGAVLVSGLLCWMLMEGSGFFSLGIVQVILGYAVVLMAAAYVPAQLGMRIYWNIAVREKGTKIEWLYMLLFGVLWCIGLLGVEIFT